MSVSIEKRERLGRGREDKDMYVVCTSYESGRWLTFFRFLICSIEQWRGAAKEMFLP